MLYCCCLLYIHMFIMCIVYTPCKNSDFCTFSLLHMLLQNNLGIFLHTKSIKYFNCYAIFLVHFVNESAFLLDREVRRFMKICLCLSNLYRTIFSIKSNHELRSTPIKRLNFEFVSITFLFVITPLT